MKNFIQISNEIYCEEFLNHINIPTKFLPNPYKDYPFMIIKSFLSQDECKQITDATQNSNNYEDAMVKSMINDNVVNPTIKQNIRKTNIHTLNEQHKKLYFDKFVSIQKSIEDFFAISLTLATTPQVLEYTKGSFYIKHSDDSNEQVDKQGNTIGFLPVAPQRKITTVLFTTSYSDTIADKYHFKGGELLFNYLYDKDGNMVTLRPEAGDIVIFPSNPYFCHEVLPVLDGYRLSIVQWHNAIVM